MIHEFIRVTSRTTGEVVREEPLAGRSVSLMRRWLARRFPPDEYDLAPAFRPVPVPAQPPDPTGFNSYYYLLVTPRNTTRVVYELQVPPRGDRDARTVNLEHQETREALERWFPPGEYDIHWVGTTDPHEDKESLLYGWGDDLRAAGILPDDD